MQGIWAYSLCMNLSNLFLNTSGDGFNYMSFVLIGVMVVLIFGMIFMQTRRRRSAMEQQIALIDRLRPGMRVRTIAGVIGRVIEIREEGAGLKTVLIETGSGKHASHVLYDVNAIVMVMDESMAEVISEPVKEEFDAASFVEQSNTQRGKKQQSQGRGTKSKQSE